MHPKNERTCVSCRNKFNKLSLIRIVNIDDNIFIDNKKLRNGRGVYVCQNSDCKNKLIKNKILNRSFKKQVSDESYEKLAELLNK